MRYFIFSIETQKLILCSAYNSNPNIQLHTAVDINEEIKITLSISTLTQVTCDIVTILGIYLYSYWANIAPNIGQYWDVNKLR